MLSIFNDWSFCVVIISHCLYLNIVLISTNGVMWRICNYQSTSLLHVPVVSQPEHYRVSVVKVHYRTLVFSVPVIFRFLQGKKNAKLKSSIVIILQSMPIKCDVFSLFRSTTYITSFYTQNCRFMHLLSAVDRAPS